MAIKRCISDIDVVQAAETRILNVFQNGLPVYLSFSGGKDSLCMAQLVVNLIQRGKIDPKQLTVIFIDEEAIFDCMEQTVKNWRKKFMLLGVTFIWFAIEVKHFNCFNLLTNDETFICWDSTKTDVWVRQPPSFAVRTHPLLRPVKDAYQDFLPRLCRDGITIVGTRAAESVQRLKNIATMTQAGKHITGKQHIFPIYDWKDIDVWLYLKNQGVDIPVVYLNLWQCGAKRQALRVSHMLTIDTARSLVKLGEHDPGLMDRIIRREPNAYIAALYWDSEMFGRKTRMRKELEEGSKPRDYRAELLVLFNDIEGNFTTKHKQYVAERYKNFFLQVSAIATPRDYKDIYEGLVSGDPKLRSFRALYQQVYGRYIEGAKKAQAQGGEVNG